MASKLCLPPGNLGLPIIGETLDFFRDPQFAQKRHDQYGSLFKTRLLGKNTIFVKGAEATRFVLMHENQYFVVGWPPSVKALLGPLSLALQQGGIHIQRRKLMAQAFQPRTLESYLPTIEAISEQYFRYWADQDILIGYPELRKYTFDIACKLFVGLDQGSQTNLGNCFEAWSEGLFSIPLRLPWTRFGKAWQSRTLLLEELERLIRERQQSETPGEDTLGILLQAKDENGQSLSSEELKDQILLLLFAGHETLTSALASFCLLMAQFPEVQAKARAEQQASSQHPLTLESLKHMTYLDQVISHIPFGGGLRECLGKEFARLEMRLFGAKLLRGYEWSLLPDQDLNMVVIPTPHPRDGLKVQFRPKAS